MIEVSAGSRTAMCDGWHRRDFLRFGSLGLLGLALPRRGGAAGPAAAEYVRDRSVVLLFLAGGPSLARRQAVELVGPKAS